MTRTLVLIIINNIKHEQTFGDDGVNTMITEMTINERLMDYGTKKTTNKRKREYELKGYKAVNGLLKIIMSLLLFITLVSVTWILLESFQLLEQVPTVASSEPQVVVVQAGDTLWNIAKMHAPEHLEFTDYMNKIKKANELNSSGLMLGQTLILP